MCMNYLPKFIALWALVISKFIGKTAHVLSYLFYSTSRQNLEMWTSWLTFLQNYMDAVLTVNVASMAALTNLWLSNNLPLVFPVFSLC